jgi:hypothetical protein
MEEKEGQMPEAHVEMLDQLFNGITRTIGAVKVNLRRNRNYVKKNHNHIGKVLSCHLVVENLIWKWLIDNKHCTVSKTKRMVFKDKLNEFKSKKLNSLLSSLPPGLEELNDLRNELAHQIDFDFAQAKTKEIEKILRMFPDYKVDDFSLEQKVEEFTNICILIFAINSDSVKKSWTNFSELFPPVDPKHGLLGKPKTKNK